MAPILVSGATGNVGRPVARRLLAAGRDVRLGVPRPAGATADPSLAGAEAVRLNFRDPATWDAAFHGVRTMFLVRPPQLARVSRDLLPAVVAGQRVGLRHVVFLSLQGAERNPVVPHATVERELRRSGLGWTFVRPSFFMQNLSTTHRSDVRDRSEVAVPAGSGRTAFVDAEDVAAVAAAALLDPAAHAGRAWTPTGPEALTYDEVAAVLTAVLGRPVHYTRPGLAAYARHARRTLKMPPAMVLVTSAIYTTARLGLAAGRTDDVRTVTGRAPVTLAEFAERERSAWLPDVPEKESS